MAHLHAHPGIWLFQFQALLLWGKFLIIFKNGEEGRTLKRTLDCGGPGESGRRWSGDVKGQSSSVLMGPKIFFLHSKISGNPWK